MVTTATEPYSVADYLIKVKQREPQPFHSQAHPMAQTYTDWTKVPAPIKRKIDAMWNRFGTVKSWRGIDSNNDPITIYRLDDYKVALNTEYLTAKQKAKLFDLSIGFGFNLSDLVQSLSFEIETVRVKDQIYHLPNLVVGVWPHCNTYGAMDEDGRIHT